MRNAFRVLAVAAIVGSAACAVPGTAEDFRWTLEVPKAVDKGADLVFKVRTLDAAGQPVEGVKYHYQILWPGGSSNPLRHGGRTGEAEGIRARLLAGPATLVVTSPDKSGALVKVGEAQFEVK